MNTNLVTVLKPQSARTKLLNAALKVVRAKGYSATSVDELCAAAGVSKGSFFHNFSSKESLGVEAIKYWSEMTGQLFESAPYHQHADPLDRVLGYIDFRSALIDGPVEAFTCLVGTMVQEAYISSSASISGHAQKLESDISEALTERGITNVTAQSLALHTQAVLQGAFILAKARNGPDAAQESVAHLKRYFEILFNPYEIERKTA
jgi:TetR/AcrR family transcriptional regulator, transcriptional repressor for nem operon